VLQLTNSFDLRDRLRKIRSQLATWALEVECLERSPRIDEDYKLTADRQPYLTEEYFTELEARLKHLAEHFDKKEGPFP
jgi:hypothetical protein